MIKRLLTSLLILPAILATPTAGRAQCPAGENCGGAFAGSPVAEAAIGNGFQGYAMQSGPKHPHFPPFGAGGHCIGFLSRLHFHGPLYNYGPYTGYYPFEPYGPWTSDLRYNGPRPGDGNCGWWNKLGGHGLGGHGLGWGHYSLCTLKNVFHRVNPCASKCGSCLDLGKCGAHGSQCSSATCGGTTSISAPVVAAEPAAACSTCAPAVVGVPVSTTTIAQPAQPVPVEVKAPTPMPPAVLTGLKK